MALAECTSGTLHCKQFALQALCTVASFPNWVSGRNITHIVTQGVTVTSGFPGIYVEDHNSKWHNVPVSSSRQKSDADVQVKMGPVQR